MNDDATIEKLVNENVKLAYYFTNKYAKKLERWVDQDEILSNAMLGLYDAAKDYDPARGAKFSTYAAIHIKKRVYRPIVDLATNKRGGLLRNHVPLDSAVDGEDGSLWHDVIADDTCESGEQLADRLTTEKMKQILSAVLPKLQPRYRLVAMFRLGLGLPRKTFEEISEYLGVSKARIQQLDELAMTALRALVSREMVKLKKQHNEKPPCISPWKARRRKTKEVFQG